MVRIRRRQRKNGPHLEQKRSQTPIETCLSRIFLTLHIAGGDASSPYGFQLDDNLEVADETVS
jgi:hypothetical protein